MHSKRALRFGSFVTLIMILFLFTATACAPAAPAATSGGSAAENSDPPITLNVWVYPYWSGITGEEDAAGATPLDIWKYMGEKFQKPTPMCPLILRHWTGEQAVRRSTLLLLRTRHRIFSPTRMAQC